MSQDDWHDPLKEYPRTLDIRGKRLIPPLPEDAKSTERAADTTP